MPGPTDASIGFAIQVDDKASKELKKAEANYAKMEKSIKKNADAVNDVGKAYEKAGKSLEQAGKKGEVADKKLFDTKKLKEQLEVAANIAQVVQGSIVVFDKLTSSTGRAIGKFSKFGKSSQMVNAEIKSTSEAMDKGLLAKLTEFRRESGFAIGMALNPLASTMDNVLVGAIDRTKNKFSEFVHKLGLDAGDLSVILSSLTGAVMAQQFEDKLLKIDLAAGLASRRLSELRGAIFSTSMAFGVATDDAVAMYNVLADRAFFGGVGRGFTSDVEPVIQATAEMSKVFHMGAEAATEFVIKLNDLGQVGQEGLREFMSMMVSLEKTAFASADAVQGFVDSSIDIAARFPKDMRQRFVTEMTAVKTAFDHIWVDSSFADQFIEAFDDMSDAGMQIRSLAMQGGLLGSELREALNAGDLRTLVTHYIKGLKRMEAQGLDTVKHATMIQDTFNLTAKQFRLLVDDGLSSLDTMFDAVDRNAEKTAALEKALKDINEVFSHLSKVISAFTETMTVTFGTPLVKLMTAVLRPFVFLMETIANIYMGLPDILHTAISAFFGLKLGLIGATLAARAHAVSMIATTATAGTSAAIAEARAGMLGKITDKLLSIIPLEWREFIAVKAGNAMIVVRNALTSARNKILGLFNKSLVENIKHEKTKEVLEKAATIRKKAFNKVTEGTISVYNKLVGRVKSVTSGMANTAAAAGKSAKSSKALAIANIGTARSFKDVKKGMLVLLASVPSYIKVIVAAAALTAAVLAIGPKRVFEAVREEFLKFTEWLDNAIKAIDSLWESIVDNLLGLDQVDKKKTGEAFGEALLEAIKLGMKIVTQIGELILKTLVVAIVLLPARAVTAVARGFRDFFVKVIDQGIEQALGEVVVGLQMHFSQMFEGLDAWQIAGKIASALTGLVAVFMLLRFALKKVMGRFRGNTKAITEATGAKQVATGATMQLAGAEMAAARATRAHTQAILEQAAARGGGSTAALSGMSLRGAGGGTAAALADTALVGADIASMGGGGAATKKPGRIRRGFQRIGRSRVGRVGGRMARGAGKALAFLPFIGMIGGVAKEAGGDLAEGVGKGFIAKAKGVFVKIGQFISKLFTKMISKAGSAISKVTGKIFGKLAKFGGKSILKKIPILGILVGLAFAVQRLMAGDILGAVGEIASGVVSMIPGLGTAASFGIDAALMARDMSGGGVEGFAKGGQMPANRLSLVGEMGPELIVGPGRVIPNNQLAISPSRPAESNRVDSPAQKKSAMHLERIETILRRMENRSSRPAISQSQPHQIRSDSEASFKQKKADGLLRQISTTIGL